MRWSELAAAAAESQLDDIIAWAEPAPWCRAMAACQQDAAWHAEGDVWTHTQMVLRELPRLAAWPDCTAADRVALVMTALFHDAAKPLTTAIDPATGHVVSPKHAVKGEVLARSVLREAGCDLATRERIAKLVRYHGRPAFLLERDEPLHEVVWLSWLVSNRLLHLFALADTRGRRTASTDRAESVVNLWQETSEEAGCYAQPYPFANDAVRLAFAHAETPSLHATAAPHARCTVTMLAGPPGAGKDTWLARHHPDLPVVALDELRRELGVDPTDNQGRVVQLGLERSREHLRAGRSFAFNATNLTGQVRRRWTGLFLDYDARVELTYLEPPLRTLRRRNAGRGAAVPESVLHALVEKAEPPTAWEAHEMRLVDA